MMLDGIPYDPPRSPWSPALLSYVTAIVLAALLLTLGWRWTLALVVAALALCCLPAWAVLKWRERLRVEELTRARLWMITEEETWR